MALRSALGATVLVLGISACSGGGKSAEETGLTASQVCASALDSSASTALQRMGDTVKFTELPGNDDSGQPNKFSLKHAASTIHENKTQRNQCTIFKAGDESGHPLIDVDFSAATYAPGKETSDEDKNSGNTVYPIGVYARTDGTSSALLYFKCRTEAPGKASSSIPYIRASLSSTPGQMSSKATSRDLMTVLNSLSGAMARQLGCSAQAALRSEVPAAVTG